MAKAKKKATVKTKTVKTKTGAKKTAVKKVPTKKPAAKKAASIKNSPKMQAAKASAPVAEESFQPGNRVPPFSLPNEKGEMISLSQFKGKKLVIYFYPKDDTPGCTKESCDFRDSFARVQSKGVTVLGVSKDGLKSHVKFKEKYSLPFSLLSDENSKMSENFGVWKEKMNYGKTYMGIERTTFLIEVDAKGKGRFLKVYPKVKVEGHVDEILKDIA